MMHSNIGVLEEDTEIYTQEIVSLQHEKAEAYRQAYIEEQAYRESAEQSLDRLVKFLREAGILHPKRHELNEENERLAREALEEEQEQRERDEERLKAQEEDEQREQEEERLRAEEAERLRAEELANEEWFRQAEQREQEETKSKTRRGSTRT